MTIGSTMIPPTVGGLYGDLAMVLVLRLTSLDDQILRIGRVYTERKQSS